MKKIVRLTESDLIRIVKRVISEQEEMPKKLRGNYRIRSWMPNSWYDEDDRAVNPLDIEDFEEFFKIYWEMEMDAHEYGIEWVNKIGNMVNLPKEYYKLSPMVTSYPSMGHMVRDQIVNINKIIKELKQKGYDYSDISDLPFVKKHLDKLEDLF